MNIALVGYGKMGKEVERLAVEKSHTIAARLNSQSPRVSDEASKSIDVVIHFATPHSVVPHVEEWARRKKNLVIGTTGWQDEVPRVRTLVEQYRIGLIYASNFSIGVNLFSSIIRHAGVAFNKFPDYDLFIHEEHHKDKVDSPSGTALSLAKLLLQVVERKKEILSSPPDGKIKPQQLHVSSTRAGAIVGTHRVVFDSAADQIELVHRAKNRSGFALGALLAAEWIRGKQGMFTMDDLVADLFQS